MPFSFGDLIVPEPIRDMVNSLITSKSAFAASGAAVLDFGASAAAGGNFVAHRRREEDATHDVVIDGSAQTPVILGAEKDVAPVLRRTRYRRVVDGAPAAEGLLSGTPTAAIVEQSAAFWARELDLALIAVINALFDASTGILRTTHKRTVAVGTGAIVPISFADIVRTTGLIGDAGVDCTAIAMHSRQYADLCLEVGAKPVFQPIGPAPVAFAAYVGTLRAIVSDLLPTSGSGTYAKYTAIALRPGALFVDVQKPVEEFLAVAPAIPAWDLTESMHFAVGANGCTFGTDVNPSNTTLATPAKWTKTAASPTTETDKQIGVLALETNAS